MTVLSTGKILSGLNMFRTTMKKDEFLDKEFSAVVEDSERRIRSCEWRDYMKEKPEEKMKVVFKCTNSLVPESHVYDVHKIENMIKRYAKIDGRAYKEGDLLWKPFETEYRIPFETVRRKLLIMKSIFDKDEYMRSKYSNLVTNIMERVNSGEWKILREYIPVKNMHIIFKALYKNSDDRWIYGTSLYIAKENRILMVERKMDFQIIKWKPLEIEELI